MSELCGAVASVQLGKLPTILGCMRDSKRRIKEALLDIAGLSFRHLNDAEGDTGPFLTMILEDEGKTVKAVRVMREMGLANAARLSEYGQHIYYNIPSLVQKVPLSSAGNPWALALNQESRYDYGKGACPRSDDLFARAVVLPIPSKLSRAQEEGAVKIIRTALGG